MTYTLSARLAAHFSDDSWGYLGEPFYSERHGDMPDCAGDYEHVTYYELIDRAIKSVDPKDLANVIDIELEQWLWDEDEDEELDFENRNVNGYFGL